MIFDHINNREKYYCLGEGYKLALDFFAAYQSAGAKKDDVVLDGDNVFVKVRPMQTKLPQDARFEAHDEYADIHFVAEGLELMGYAERSTMTVEEADTEKDVLFLGGEGQYLIMKPGYFMITLAQDAHKPALSPDGKCAEIVKLIAKVKL